MENRCQIFRVSGYDLTGESAMECAAPADYCDVCDMIVCAECHAEMAGEHLSYVKKPPMPVADWNREGGRKISG